VSVCVYLCVVVAGSEYDKQSLLSRYGENILRPRDTRKVSEICDCYNPGLA